MNYWDEAYQFARKMEDTLVENDRIADEQFVRFGVNRGLRDPNGKGVLTGLTNISKILAYDYVDGKKIPSDGKLWYRGYRIENIIDNVVSDGFGFEKTAFLLIFGYMPDDEEMEEFLQVIKNIRKLPANFTRDIIMKSPSADVMNSMTRSILSLASYDNYALSTDASNVIRQSLMLVAIFPLLAVYAYHAHNHYNKDQSMYIHNPDPEKSTAENFLRLLRPDKKYTETEAKALDAALILHMEHGGGNNSTFTTRVVSSTGSDTYSSVAAGMCSLKGPRHGGANIKVMQMIDDIKAHVKDTRDEKEVGEYLRKILDKKAFDGKGLIYGIGHAIYTISDPRAKVFHKYVQRLVEEKNCGDEYAIYETIEKVAPKVINEKRNTLKPVCPNIDFYSGFVYRMMGIPEELFTPLFSIARIAGWSAHRLEEITGDSRIIRPAYMSVMKDNEDMVD